MYINLLTQIKIRDLLFLKISFAIINRWVNKMWDAIGNIWTNLLKQMSQKIYVNNQQCSWNWPLQDYNLPRWGNTQSGLKNWLRSSSSCSLTCTRDLFIATTSFEYFQVFRGDIWDQYSTEFWNCCFITIKW